MEYPKFKVHVLCCTYNQSKYITDAMNGFVMQQTDFPFVCSIIDDASTDGEQDVIKKYVENNFDLTEGSCHFERETDYAFITYAQHKTNKNCYFAVLYLKENHYSIRKPKMPYLAEWRDMCEYEALCEGDDYWIHPGKLQMQADFLDNHTDYSMCFHAHDNLYSDGRLSPVHRYNQDMEICPIKDMILEGGGYAKINAMVIRASLYSGYTSWAADCFVGDLPMQLTLFVVGKVGYIDCIMSCYRFAAEGSWTEMMESDSLYKKKHHFNIRKTWWAFNRLTENKYRRYVLMKILKNDINYYSQNLRVHSSAIGGITYEK